MTYAVEDPHAVDLVPAGIPAVRHPDLPLTQVASEPRLKDTA
jgi:hypothetical protein